MSGGSSWYRKTADSQECLALGRTEERSRCSITSSVTAEHYKQLRSDRTFGHLDASSNPGPMVAALACGLHSVKEPARHPPPHSKRGCFNHHRGSEEALWRAEWASAPTPNCQENRIHTRGAARGRHSVRWILRMDANRLHLAS